MSAPLARADLGTPTAADRRWHAHLAATYGDVYGKRQVSAPEPATDVQLAEIAALQLISSEVPSVTPSNFREAEAFCLTWNHIARRQLQGCGVMERMKDGVGCGHLRCEGCGSNPAQRSSERAWFRSVTSGGNA